MTRTTAELGFSPSDRVLIVCGPAALGLHFWLPFRPLFVVAGAVDAPWELAVQGAILVILGLVGTATLFEHLTTITVAFADARFGPTELSRSEITALYPEGDTLVVLDRESRQVVRCTPRARRGVMAATFREFGYPWHDADPYASLYLPWLPAAEALPTAADAVLSARAVALSKKATGEAADLRATLEKLGYSVRDERGRQFWRPLVRS
jgi:hypothetical protein